MFANRHIVVLTIDTLFTGVLWVFLFLALVRCFPLYTAGVPRALTLFIKVFLYLSNQKKKKLGLLNRINMLSK
jgi:hypothetical protein